MACPTTRRHPHRTRRLTTTRAPAPPATRTRATGSRVDHGNARAGDMPATLAAVTTLGLTTRSPPLFPVVLGTL